MKVLDLGEKEGPLLIFGGPHSNLQALDAILELAGQLNIPTHAMISTGDTVAYCADPETTVQRIRAEGIQVLAGNCEKQLGSDSSDCGCGFGEGTVCDLLAIGWYVHSRVSISDESRKWMSELPDRICFRQNGKRYVVIHGGATAINRFLFPVSPAQEFEEEIAQLRKEIGPFDSVIAGHSGISFIRQIGGVEWINAGAAGMPENDGNPQTRYLTLQNGKAELHRLNYDYRSAAQAMKQVRLTQGYHEALVSGYWPSQDVLPPEMRHQTP